MRPSMQMMDPALASKSMSMDSASLGGTPRSGVAVGEYHGAFGVGSAKAFR
jgi:hypothetical protein